MVFPMMVTLKVKKVFEGGDAKTQVLIQLVNFGVIPFVAFGLGVQFFEAHPYTILGLLLAGLLPTSGMTISWTGFAKGSVEAAIKMTVIGLLLGAAATPFYVKFLMGAELNVDLMAIIKQILVIVLLPMIAGFITQQTLVKRVGQKNFQKTWAPKFPVLAILGVLGIVFVAIALKAKAIAESPQMLFYTVIPLLVFYGLNYFITTIIGRLFLTKADAIALVYGTVMRNLSIALAIAINVFGSEGSSAALVIALAYVIQVQSAAWYIKLANRLFETKKAMPAGKLA